MTEKITKEELNRVEQEAWEITQSYRNGYDTWLRSFEALKKAKEMREIIIEAFREGQLVWGDK